VCAGVRIYVHPPGESRTHPHWTGPVSHVERHLMRTMAGRRTQDQSVQYCDPLNKNRNRRALGDDAATLKTVAAETGLTLQLLRGASVDRAYRFTSPGEMKTPPPPWTGPRVRTQSPEPEKQISENDTGRRILFSGDKGMMYGGASGPGAS